ncbi:hypothetical protein DLM78_07335 [Leptospira stimsonii]|uniref:Uncharacterized protein n=1 Tax=Leptospira stimsonii TaxID=2202203 RepID=A0A8B3CX63_9LEPT|nr:hypothetical protein DLM78_07335 [Leptospira stimsonii]
MDGCNIEEPFAKVDFESPTDQAKISLFLFFELDKKRDNVIPGSPSFRFLIPFFSQIIENRRRSVVWIL